MLAAESNTEDQGRSLPLLSPAACLDPITLSHH
jgi:hypothetical protein